MSNIRSYMKQKEKRAQKAPVINTKGEFADKIKKHRLNILYRIIIAIVIICGAAAAFYISYRDKVYTQMQVTSTVKRQAISGTKDIRLGSNLVTYSNDGISCMDAKGNAIWNQTYEMQNPIYSICQDVIAIADYNGRTVYVMNGEKKLGEITTNMPIRNLCVAANGVVMTVQEDAKVTWIYLYDTQGEELVYFHTRMENSGYPTAISMSANARLVGISYTYLDAGELKTRVAFYNFGDVGENKIDRLVGGYNYSDALVPYMHFMNSSTVFAVADNRLMIYSGSEVPETQMEKMLDEEIQAVYHSDKYIGLVFFGNGTEGTYKLEVLNTQGQPVTEIPFTLPSLSDARVVFDEDSIIIYNETECKVYNYSGREKFSGSFEKSVRVLIPMQGSFRYLIATQDSLDIVELK